MAISKTDFRKVIIKKSSEVFNHFGYKKTTMDDIANAVAKGKSSIYYYFKSKEDIYKAVIEQEAEILRNELLNSINKVNEPIDKIRNYVLTRMQVHKKVNNFYKALTNDMLLQLPFIEAIRAKYEKQELKLVKDILDKGISENKFEIEESDLGAVAIVTALKGLESSLFSLENQSSIEARLDQFLKVIFLGIVKR